MEGEAQARPDVVAAVNLGVGNGRVESINQKIKVAIDSGYGFRNVGSLSPIVTLRCSDENPAMSWGLEGREAKEGREEEGGGQGARQEEEEGEGARGQGATGNSLGHEHCRRHCLDVALLTLRPCLLMVRCSVEAPHFTLERLD